MEETVSRLASRGVRPPGLLIGGPEPLTGRLRPPRAHIGRRAPWSRNGLQVSFTGRLETTPTGCRLAGRLGPNRFAVAYLTVWFGIAATVLVVGTIGSIVQLDPVGLVPIGLLAGLGALAAWMVRESEADRRVVLAELTEALGVEPDIIT